jgi:tRNA (mo5U34)-methyltransferase
VTLPTHIGELSAAGEKFAADLRALKARVEVPDYGWYPYETLTALPVFFELLEPAWEELRECLTAAPLADIGCGDGDLAAFFAHAGCTVDAFDHVETNFNQMRGVATLSRELGLPVAAHDLDLDRPFALPRADYGLALFLGTLYHLKNPFYVLENLAARADWCVLSTRIAQMTPRGARIEGEPVAYLLGAREANNDPTNFWIFSAAGLMRLLERAGWMIVSHRRLGCTSGSEPVDPAADERIFVLCKSRTRHPALHVRTLDGWHAIESDALRWAARRFALEVTLPEPAREFALRFFVPEPALAAGPIRVSCRIGGLPVGSITCDRTEGLEFRGRFPSAETTQRLDFTVESSFHPPGDSRDLGICVPLLDASHRNTQRLPFRIS